MTSRASGLRRPLMLAAVLVAALLATAPPASANPPGTESPRLYVPHYNNDEIGGFEVGGAGGPFPIVGSPFDGGSGGLIALAFTPEGSRAAAAFLFNGGAQGLSVTPHGSVALAGSAIASPSATSVAVSPDGHFAYTPTRTFGATPGVGIVRYSIGDGGALTSVGSSPSPNDYYGIAVTPDGRFLYASGLNGIDRYAIALDGSLTGPTCGAVLHPGAQARRLTRRPPPLRRRLLRSRSGLLRDRLRRSAHRERRPGADRHRFGRVHRRCAGRSSHLPERAQPRRHRHRHRGRGRRSDRDWPRRPPGDLPARSRSRRTGAISTSPTTTPRSSWAWRPSAPTEFPRCWTISPLRGAAAALRRRS